MKRWRTRNRKVKRRNGGWPNRRYWRRLLHEARKRVARREAESWPPKFEEFFKA